MIQISPEQEKNLRDRIAALQLKTGVVVTPELMKQLMVQLALKDPVTWGMTYRNLKGEPYRFELPVPLRDDPKFWNRHRPFLKQMLQDQAKNKCYEKSRQCGASESSVTEVLWFLSCHKATKAVYVFPTQQQMEDFSNSRIDPCLDESDYLRSLRGKTDNVKMKQIGSNSFLFMRSGQTSRAGEGVDADALFIDEKDRMSDKIEAAFEQSLSSSSYALLREFSTPTLPGMGVDKSFQASCQYHWFVKCDSGHWQTLSYDPSDGGNIKQLRDLDPAEEVVPPGSFALKCTHKGINGEECPSQIDRWNGEWVAAFDDHRKKTHAGYHINQLSCFEAGTPVLMADGTIKAIEDVKIEDCVITHKGRSRKVLWTIKKKTDNVFRLKTAIGKHTRVSGEHPYLVSRPKKHSTYTYLKFKPEDNIPVWVNVENIQTGDWLCYPKHKSLENVGDELCDLETARIIGLFAAEGWARRLEFGFCFHENEIELHEYVYRWLDARNITYRCVKNKDSRSFNIVASSKEYAKYFVDLCKTGAINKILPEWVFDMTRDKRMALLEGLIKGDGHFCYQNGKVSIGFSTISPHLAYGVQRLLAQDDIYAGISVIKYSEKNVEDYPPSWQRHNGNPKKWNDCYKLSVCYAESIIYLREKLNWLEVPLPNKKRGVGGGYKRWRVGDDYLYIRVVDKEHIKETIDVYNFEVEEDHSYIANSVAVHNCVWISIDAIMQQMRKYQFMDAFYNYVLGMPYSSNEGLISEEALKNCIDQTVEFPGFRRPVYNAVVAGIDWGRLNWCVVLGRRTDGKWEVCGLKYVSDHTDVLVAAKALGDYLRPFNPNYIVADFGYGRDRCMELQRQYPERVYACLYSSGRVTDTTFNPTWQESQFRVTVNRTAHLRWMLEFIKRRKVSFPGHLENYDKFFKHILNLALIHEEEEDPKTKETAIVERIGKKGDDHYAHAMAYAVLAAQKLTEGGGFFYEFLSA